MRRCVPPIESATSQTGLVIGYVQSGKTTSFTTLAALARDNGYRMVIVIAGTTEPLFFQTRDRLIDTLRLEIRPRNNPWRHISQPKLREDSHVMIRDTLLQWNSPTATSEERRTVLITVMKHHQHLQNLIDVLRQVNIQNVPTLIIDDEGDQAGMNTLVNQGQESTTYRRLLALKAALPHHSYLQFTATPQAPLLISIAVAGLWAELLLIARSSDPACLLGAWHAIPEERFDFGHGIDRLDVKAASGGLRLHHFTLEQLRPTGPVRVLIASVLTERSEGGTSLNDLVDSIRARVADPDHLIRLDSVVAQTLGQDWRTMQQIRFDLQHAAQSFRFIDATTIPSVAVPAPPEVSAVHFRVDLTQHPMPFPDALIQGSGVFRAAIPRTDL